MNTAAIDRLSDEDTQILKLGRGVIRGHTCKVMVLEPSPGSPLPSVEAIREHVAARLDEAPRFRRRVVSTPLRLANPVWVDDPDFDIANHVTAVPTDHPLSREELNGVVARLMAEPLPPARPLWHLAVVEHRWDGGMALVWRVHHSLADGTTCVRLASALLWDSEPRDQLGEESPWRPELPPSRLTLLRSGLAERMARRGSGQPRVSLQSLAATEAVTARELRPTASVTRLAGRVGSDRRVAFASVPLQEARRAGKAISESVTVNDVVLSMIAGAVRSWLGSSRSIRVKVPVSLHQHDNGAAMSNHDSFFFVDLPVDESDPVRRVLAINQETQERKLHHDAETLYHLGTHPAISHWSMSPHVFTFNVSNVPGPKEDVFVLGGRVVELYTLAEIARHHALRVAVISAAGSLFFGLCADRAAVPDLDGLADGIHRGAEELLALAG